MQCTGMGVSPKRSGVKTTGSDIREGVEAPQRRRVVRYASAQAGVLSEGRGITTIVQEPRRGSALGSGEVVRARGIVAGAAAR